MAYIIYNWKRYWVPRDGGFSFDSDGFLLPPASDADGFVWWKTDVVAFEELLSKPCLVLLGEPGIGKSFAIRQADSEARAARQGSAATFLSRDLGSYNTDIHLVADVFRSPEFAKSRREGGELHVFLDSFDECLLRVDAVAALLAEQISRLQSVQNLFLRITSRTAEWQVSLEDALRQKWSEDAVGVYELAPLTREQVLVAAKTHLTEPERFIEEVVASEVVSFAIKPLTLDLLIRVWRKRGGSLPPTQREIYEQGCLELCSDSERRQTPKLRRHFSTEQRLAVASHIAAATFFCNRTAVWTGSRQSTKPESDISVSELAYGSVTTSGARIAVTESAIRETLDTGLFTSRGRYRLGWAHQTYGEFLAARYLAQEGLSGHQMLDLLAHSHDPERKLNPQLHETAAWVASTNQDLFDHLARTQPEVLLRSDVATADAETKSNLLDALLEAVGRNSIHVDWWAMRKRYRKLCHPRLVRQLRRYLRDRSVSADARTEAVSIAEACELNELWPDLAKIALDSGEVQRVRERAAATISNGGDMASKKRLRALALGNTGTDPNNDLRGAGLQACWPTHISVRELFASLVDPGDGPHGLYERFLSHGLVDHLSPADLPIALKWAEAQPERHDSFTSYGGLVMRIVERAAEYIADVGILLPFARTLLVRLRKHDYSQVGESSLATRLEAQPDLRLKLVEALVPLINDARRDSNLVSRRGLRLLVPEDLPWLVEKLQSTELPQHQFVYAHLLSWIFYPDNASRVNIVIEASQVCPMLVEVMPHWLKPMALDSEEARNARDRFFEERRDREEMEKRRQPKLLSPAPAERLIALLDQFESGDLEAWWKLWPWLEADDNGRYCEKHYSMDIRDLVGWEKASGPTRARMVAAADLYVRGRGSSPEEWFKRRNIRYYPAVSGFRALLLLANEAPAQFENLPDEVWQRWAPAILRPHHFHELQGHQLLTTKAFQCACREATEWTLKVISEENEEGDNLWILSKLPEQWSDELGAALLERAKRGRLKPQCLTQLLTALVEHHIAGALDLTRSHIPKKPPARKSRRLVSLFAARLLMSHGETSDWQRIWRLLNADTAFGRELFEGFAHDYAHAPAPVLKTMRAEDVGALWQWMLAQYPVGEDRDRRGGGEVKTRDAIADFRDHLISYLADVGTEAGCRELQRLIAKYPQFSWFRRVLGRGQEQTRRNTWTPPGPNQLFQLAENRRARLVQSAAQLLEAVTGSLALLQEKLRGERQMAQFFWDGDKPKPEEAISEWIAAHLEDDLKQRGIILGREVQIHTFDKTDVHVTAVSRDERTGAFERVKVIIEVKGCWHREVKTAMKAQLLDRYLADNDCRHGLYLVGWFSLDSWSKSDKRRKQVRFPNREGLDAYLAKQAQALSNNGHLIQATVMDFSVRTPAPKPRSSRIVQNRRQRKRSIRKKRQSFS